MGVKLYTCHLCKMVYALTVFASGERKEITRSVSWFKRLDPIDRLLHLIDLTNYGALYQHLHTHLAPGLDDNGVNLASQIVFIIFRFNQHKSVAVEHLFILIKNANSFSADTFKGLE